MPEKSDPFQDFEEWVNQLVKIPSATPIPIKLKLGLLERMIERWRIHQHELENSIPFEEFLSWVCWIDDGRLNFSQRQGSLPASGTGIPPVRYQRTLLVYLLLHHQRRNRRVPVLDIIREFISDVRSHLSPEDFKKTDTGVIRCFTNTRFAANKLRQFGLLKYTRHEAFKTWTLSLPGIIIAARALQDSNWKIPDFQHQSLSGLALFGLDPFIASSASSVKDFSAVVSALSALCGPNVKVFETFNGVLTEALALLQQYWSVLKDPKLTHKERSARSLACCHALECLPLFDQFVDEFVDCIQIEELLKKATTVATQS